MLQAQRKSGFAIVQWDRDLRHPPHQLLARDGMSLAGPPLELLPLRDHLVDFDIPVGMLRIVSVDLDDVTVDLLEAGRRNLECVLVDVEEAAAVAAHRTVGHHLLARVNLDHRHVI